MNISLLEPLNINDEEITALSKPIIEMGHNFKYYNNKTTNIDELIKRSLDQDIVMIANNPYPKEVIDKANKLKMIAVAFAGIDHVDIKAAKEKNIQITNCPNYSNNAVSELVIGMSLTLLRKLKEADKATREGLNNSTLIGEELNNKTVGIIGCGHIGSTTANLFNAFGCKVLGYQRNKITNINIKQVSLNELLKQSDIISLHIPYNEDTYHFINEEKLKMMKHNAIIINCARGPIIDNVALAKALNQEQLGGAGIDVFDKEPPLNNDYPLLKCRNIILTPHIGYFTKEAMKKRAVIEFNNVISFLKNN